MASDGDAFCCRPAPAVLPAAFGRNRAAAASVAAPAAAERGAGGGRYLSGGTRKLPDGAAGTYALSPDPAEVIEIILNGDGDSVRLQGYLTRIGDGASDRGAPLTYFFARTTVSPTQLTFHHEAGAWRVVELCGNDRSRERADERAEGLLLPERNAYGALRYRPIGAAAS